MSHYVVTATGARVYLGPAPGEQDIRISDIAHALSNLCRFNGHTRLFWSVACHSLHVVELLDRAGHSPAIRLEGLMHDAAEAYIGDISTPVRRQLADTGQSPLDRVESGIDAAIRQRTGLPPAMSPSVAEADRCALIYEAREFVGADPVVEWGYAPPTFPPVPGLSALARLPMTARAAFISTYEALCAAAGLPPLPVSARPATLT